MKFHFFHLMPYPDLPSDFRQKNRSIWVDVPSRLFDPAKGHQIYNEYMDELEYAEGLGFDGICVNEHHSNAYGLMPSPNIIAGALARKTSKAKIVVMGNSVALYNPPIRVAEEMAMLDVMSGGRLVAGFPVGTSQDTAFAYGQNPATLREKYREGVELIMRAWREPEPFSFNGRFTQLRYVNVWPRPMQQPHPPVWIPGGGSIETWDWCIDNDFLYAYLSYFGYQRGREVIDGFWDVVDKRGAEPNPYRVGFLQFVAIADNDAEAERLYAKHAIYFYNNGLHIYPGFSNAPGYASTATIRRGIEGQVNLAAKQAAMSGELTWKDIVDRGYVLVGNPDTIVEHIERIAKTMRIGHLMVLCHFGSMPKDVTLNNATRFAREVMPRVKHLFGEWEDRWWPRETADVGPSTSPAPAIA